MKRALIQGQILVDGAAVLEAAVEAKNGRLYVMDGVLTPPSIQPVLPHRCDVTETKIVKVSRPARGFVGRRGRFLRCLNGRLSFRRNASRA